MKLCLPKIASFYREIWCEYTVLGKLTVMPFMMIFYTVMFAAAVLLFPILCALERFSQWREESGLTAKLSALFVKKKI